MDNIVRDYRKCVSIIDSCFSKEQLLNCEKLIEGFKNKHSKNKTSFMRWKELYMRIHKNYLECEKESFTLIRT